MYRMFRAVGFGLSTFVIASTAAYAQSAADAVSLEEIVVTAQKREQTFQDLALSAAVVTQADLEKTGATSVQDAIRLVPGVKIQNIAGTGSGRVFIRGIGTTSGDEFNSVISNGVNLNLDGVNSNNASNALNTMFDVERVEVLKGPQGTLYGSSALGGVVNVITARPKQEFEAQAKAQVGNYDLRHYQGMINIPLGDTFAIRITGDSNKRHGYVGGPKQYHVLFPPTSTDYYVQADNHGAVDSTSYRIKAQWKPTDAFTALISYERADNKGTSPTWLNPEDVMNGDLVCCNLGPGAPPAAFTVSWYENRYFKRWTDTYSGEFSYDFGNYGVLTFLPSHNVIHDLGQELTAAQAATNQPSEQTQDTYELRLNSPASSDLVWVVGLYATSSDRHLSDDGTRAPSPDTDQDLSTVEYGFQEVGRPFDTFNAFAQTTIPFTDRFRGTFGARYSANKADYTYQLYLTENPCTASEALSITCPDTDTVVSTSPVYSTDTSHPSTTWKAGFEYDLAEKSLLYGTVATGFKSGGVQTRNTGNAITTMEAQDLGGYKNETSISYELGSKNRFVNNTVQFNASIFYTTWKNMQLNTFVCISPGCVPFSDPTYVAWFNAGPSHQYGLEMEGIWAITAQDRLNFSSSFMHGEYGETSYPWSAPGFNGIVNLKGRKMAQMPSAAGSLGYSHITYIGSGELTSTIEAEYSSAYEVTHEYFFAGHEQPSYFRNNASLSYEQGGLQATAYLRNAQNKTTIQSVFPFGVQAGEPRTFGVTVGYSWK